MESLVSVIIPCYNQGIYIEETIKSVLNSTYCNLEIIVINDGSTDLVTRKILEKNLWPKTTIYNIENQGVAFARNLAIKYSTGKYILPLDADDLISRDYIFDAVSILDKDPETNIIYCEVEMFGIKRGPYELPEHSIENILGQNTMVVSSMFRRIDFDKTNGFRSNMAGGFEDWDFWLTLIENGANAAKLSYPGFFYRIQRKSRNHSINNEQFSKLRRQIYENHIDLYSKHFLDPVKSFEYSLIKNSKEYKVGKAILKPIRYLIKLLQ